ncbi:Lipase [Operophtera brumata]|uniref:Lipase n=1 Tax=Operophtera brumata TaxID=104452 RepID=A0A0L7L5K9_OPEBR|nr:Lipase [Operophtera brumata]
MSIIYAVITVLLIHGASSLLSPSAIKGTLMGIPEDGLLNFTQMAVKYNKSAEEHQVTTEDGYVLTLFRLPGDKGPVLMNHGVFDSADGWILRGNNSLAIMLADAGYDVWLANQRGCRYSRKHVSLNPDKDPEFWDYSAHEYGIYDLPANIDYILNATGQSQLIIIGFSEGTTATFILGSTKPEYNAKIKSFVALAPIAFLQNASGPLKALIHLGPLLNGLLPFFEISGFFSLSKAIINLICTQLVIGYDFCFGVFFNPLIGPHFEAIDSSFFKVIIGHFPAGTSKKNLIHYSQIGIRSTFAAYDYGTLKNLEIYGAFVPPSYDLGKVTMKVVLVSGRNDKVSAIADVQILRDKLPNVVDWNILEDPLYNHLDHLWAVDAHKVEYPYVIDMLANCFFFKHLYADDLQIIAIPKLMRSRMRSNRPCSEIQRL